MKSCNYDQNPMRILIAVGLASGCYVGTNASPESTGATDGSSVDSNGSSNSGMDDGAGTDGIPSDDGPLVFEPGPAVLPRLTSEQYRNSVHDLLGDNLPDVELELDTNPYLFFSIGATSTTLSELGVQRYEEAADLITHSVFDDPQRRLDLVGCDPQEPGDACIEEFITDFGQRVYRRPLTPDEVENWRQASVDLALPDLWEGVRLVVAGLLQSPHFIYRVELGEPDPEHPETLRYTSHEMASRLSFLLWNTTPDETLLEAAKTEELLHAEGLLAHAERMLADPRANQTIQSFFAQYFDLDRLDYIERNPENYPMFATTLASSMRTETQLLVDDFVFERDADIRGIFGTRRTFVNDELAMLYGVDAPGSSADTFVPVQLPENGPRVGLLTLGAFLMMNAHETEPSPTLRGKYLRERVLCQVVVPPPDDVDTSIPEEAVGENQTLRERLEAHASDPSCAGCHDFIDPPGYLFENFDSIGNYRTVDFHGNELDASGNIDGTPLASATELGPVLAEDPRVGRCVVTQMFRHAQGRLELKQEKDILIDLDRKFAQSDYRFKQLIFDLVTHEGFRTVASDSEGI